MTRGDEAVRLEPKALHVLKALHQRDGRTVRKDELLGEVWPDVAVSDEVLTTAIYQLRRALGDDRRQPKYIETVPRVGYRMVTGIQLPPPRVTRRVSPWVIAVVITLLGTGYLVTERRRIARVGAARELHRIAGAALARGSDLGMAATMLRRATNLHPGDPSIHGSLALALTLADSRNSDEKRAAIDRALRLDSRNSNALVARGLVALWDDWNWTEAIRDLRMAASKGDTVARAWLGYTFALSGDSAAARSAVAGIASPPAAVLSSSTALLLVGDIDAAERVVASAMRGDPENNSLTRQLAKIRDRRLERAGTVLSQTAIDRPTDIARLQLLSGDSEKALDTLERAWRERDHHLLYLRVDTRWDPIRHHKRFQAIATAVGP